MSWLTSITTNMREHLMIMMISQKAKRPRVANQMHPKAKKMMIRLTSGSRGDLFSMTLSKVW
jgi:hypothetical protein